MSLRKALTGGKSAFVPFVMAGDPSMAVTEKIVIALEKAGADALELGVPFSDPVADGVTVQKAAERALAAGATLQGVLDLVKKLRASGVKIPICLFSYLNPIYMMGYEAFITAAKSAGAQGALIVDLPPEEAEEYQALAKQHGFETVFLCSPTTTPERLKLVDDYSTGFVYYVSREGVTGAQAALPAQVNDRITALKQQLKNPLAIGFGISTPEHVRALRGKADGIVVGSALVKIIEENPANAAEAVEQKVRALLA
ncbi:MAG TPA: tryptophan synthase subunit alpha [Patescibacteria group bacterium]|nr:tryptophan synthase subunit alpha [Patescibacteria group bacterium]